jgi:pyridoxal phosphate enzyme (YggS family)
MGENRVQEAAEKIPALAGLRVDWHFIGHLQSNKARQAIRLFSTVQSIDSVDLARVVNRLAAEQGKQVRVLLEVNTSGEPSKHGFAPTEIERATPVIQSMSALEIEGLMTVGPLTSDAHQTRQAFRLLKSLRDQLAARYTEADWDTLSMGMTDDFEIAVEEGSTLVRVGRAIFGPRS